MKIIDERERQKTNAERHKGVVQVTAISFQERK